MTTRLGFLGLSFALLASALADDAVFLVQTNKPNRGWSFEPGAEVAGATGGLARDSKVIRNRLKSLRLDADFTGGGSYVQAMTDLQGTDIDQLAFWLKTSVELSQLTTRLVDDTGACHQIVLKIKPTTDW